MRVTDVLSVGRFVFVSRKSGGVCSDSGITCSSKSTSECTDKACSMCQRVVDSPASVSQLGFCVIAFQITIQIEFSTSPLSKHSPTPSRPLDRSMPAAPSEAFLASDPTNVQPLPSSTLGRKFCSLLG
jgi:hypothetical protein